MHRLINTSKSKVISLNKLNKNIFMDLNNPVGNGGNISAKLNDYQLEQEFETLKAQKHLLQMKSKPANM